MVRDGVQAKSPAGTSLVTMATDSRAVLIATALAAAGIYRDMHECGAPSRPRLTADTRHILRNQACPVSHVPIQGSPS